MENISTNSLGMLIALQCEGHITYHEWTTELVISGNAGERTEWNASCVSLWPLMIISSSLIDSYSINSKCENISVLSLLESTKRIDS